MKSHLKRLLKNHDGHFALMTALIAVPLIGATAMGLDVGIALTKKFELQNAADAAVLAAATTNFTLEQDIRNEATKVFLANAGTDFASTAVIGDIVFSSDHRVTLSASAKLPLTLGRAIFTEGLNVSVVAQAQQSNIYKVEIAMVLDNTYSMVGQKLKDLKTASNSLLTVFEDNDNDNVKFALVPFSRYVNVGTGNRGQKWLTVADDYSTTKNVCTTSKPVTSKSGCTTKTVTSTNDGVVSTSQQETCTAYTYGDPVTTCKDQTSNYKWSGCVGSRNSPLDITDTKPTNTYTGLVNTSCSTAITPLTNDYTKLRKAVAAMVANNETYISAGVLWGWNALSPVMPFEEAQPYNQDNRKYMIVMTDGTNTLSPSYPKHDKTDTAKADGLMVDTCTNAKATGITIFTVAVGVTNTSTAKSLASCATDADKAITVENTDTLVEVFEGIANQIMAARLTM